MNVRTKFGFWTCSKTCLWSISLVAEKWQVMASERTSTMRSPCDNHAITSRAEVVANWPQVNARQSHDKRATILRHSCHCQSMWCQVIRGRNMRCMHMLKLFAPPLFENPGSAPASLPVTCTLLSTPCSQTMANSSAHDVHVEVHRLTLQVVQVVLQPPCFSAEATFVMYWNECMFLLLNPSDQPFEVHLLLSMWFLLLVSTLHTLVVARSGKLRQGLRSWRTTYC